MEHLIFVLPILNEIGQWSIFNKKSIENLPKLWNSACSVLKIQNEVGKETFAQVRKSFVGVLEFQMHNFKEQGSEMVQKLFEILQENLQNQMEKVSLKIS